MNTPTAVPDAGPVLNISSYLFASLTDLKPLRDSLRRACKKLDLRGTILLSTEGINLFVAGPEENVHKLLEILRKVPGLEKLEAKESFTSYQPFRRMLVKIKKEIIAFGIDGIEPAERTSPKLPPQQLKQWLDEGKPLLLYDVRNDYEVKVGTFEKAVPAGIDTFRDFPEAVASLPEDAKSTPVVMFCTGGIRCEKAGPFMQQAGFNEVYQLEGGILKYFELVGGDHYQGDCFVFDQRVAVDPKLQESAVAQCFACQTPLTTEEQNSPLYVPGTSCPHCFKSAQETMAEVIAKRQEKLKQVTSPLPGSIPYTNTRRIFVSSEQKGKTLYEVLAEKVPAASHGFWERMVAQQLLVEIIHHQDERLQEFHAADPNVPLNAGQLFEQRYPGTTEPDVSTDIQILYEDSGMIVVSKPAPLPMHPCGRFNKNSLISFLEQVYHPQKLRIAHRLDANTTGVAVLSRTSAVARQIQPQFEQGKVEKRYLALVHGHPAEDEFICDEPIGTSRVTGGGRRVEAGGQESRTDFLVKERFDDGTALLEVSPKTGRTNQIRLHLWHLGYPIVGDPMYQQGGVMQQKQTLGVEEPPMCLHAWEVRFRHPQTAEMVTFQAPAPTWATSEKP
ncbi:sulfurtransferase [Bremerella sp. T1]|uniref:sulfurtransferase n=1 Tax=Bremerella sp. TYQ1 TaxID=3119568 RepID=UPI001CCE0EE3|nr:sulfurtransferase [Bremerella volcania]UBM36094.1 sulfurtransferase [Bremerella volcania]